MLKSLVFSLSTTVRGTRDSLREADQTFSVRLRIIGSVSDNGTSCSKVSSAEIDLGGLFGTTWLLSMPRDNSYRRTPIAAKLAFEHRKIQATKVAHRLYAKLLKFLFGHFAHARQASNRQWQQKCTHLLWLNHEESIRLPPV